MFNYLILIRKARSREKSKFRGKFVDFRCFFLCDWQILKPNHVLETLVANK